jgi:gliding motility-associated-like protein
MRTFKVHITILLLIGVCLGLKAAVRYTAESTPGVARFSVTSKDAVAYTWLVNGKIARDSRPVDTAGNRIQVFDTTFRDVGEFYVSVIPISDSGVWGIPDSVGLFIYRDFADFSVQSTWLNSSFDVCQRADTSRNIVNIGLTMKTDKITEGDAYTIVYNIDDGNEQRKTFNSKMSSFNVNVKGYETNFPHELKILQIYYGEDTSSIINYRSDPQIMALNVRKLPYVNLGKDIDICQHEEYIFSAGNDQKSTYIWNDTTINTVFKFNTSVADIFKVWVRRTDSYNCSATDTTLLTIHPTPNLNIKDFSTHKAVIDTMLCGQQKIKLDADDVSGKFYEWSVRDDETLKGNSSTFEVNALDPFATDSIRYVKVKVSTEFMCEAVDSIILARCTPPSDDIVPTAFTPNGDKKNDYWEVPYLEFYPDATVDVYDRWGRVVFHSKGYSSKWDGKFEGKNQPMDNYFYIIQLDPKAKPISGKIMIIR